MLDVLALVSFIRNARVVDLSQTLEEHMPSFPAHARFFSNPWNSYALGDRSLHYQLIMSDHSGTHVDAPIHFLCNGPPDAHVAVDQIPPTRLIGRGVRIDFRGLKEGDYVTAARVIGWEGEHGEIAAGDIVLLDFGWAQRWSRRPNHHGFVDNWPGVSMDAAEYLISKSVAALGVDTLSPDPPEVLSTKLVHPVLLERQVLIIENLTNLDQVSDFFLFVALPLKIRGGSGSPIRAIAFI